MEYLIENQTGWKRPYPKMVCQDLLILKKINKFDFDVSNIDFIKYFIRRTGINLLHKGFNIDVLNKIMTNYRQLSDRILRSRMQDCWELYKNNVEVSGAKNV